MFKTVIKIIVESVNEVCIPRKLWKPSEQNILVNCCKPSSNVFCTQRSSRAATLVRFIGTVQPPALTAPGRVGAHGYFALTHSWREATPNAIWQPVLTGERASSLVVSQPAGARPARMNSLLRVLLGLRGWDVLTTSMKQQNQVTQSSSYLRPDSAERKPQPLVTRLRRNAGERPLSDGSTKPPEGFSAHDSNWPDSRSSSVNAPRVPDWGTDAWSSNWAVCTCPKAAATHQHCSQPSSNYKTT